MDGVIVQSEHLWDTMEPPYLKKILAPEIAKQIIGNTRGCSVSVIYETAKKYGYSGIKEEFYSGYYPLGEEIYSHAPITIGMEGLIKNCTMTELLLDLFLLLVNHGYSLL